MDKFLVGVCTASVTPSLGTPLGGYRRYRPASSVLDELKVKCLALQHNKRVLVVISADALAVSNHFVRKVKPMIASQLAINDESILIAASHTHSAPDTLGFASLRNRKDGREYLKVLQTAMLQVASRAWREKFTAQAYASTGKALIGFNRVNTELARPLYRTLLRTGLIRFVSGVTDLLPLESRKNSRVLVGPVDPSLNVIWFEGTDGRGAALVNYACHPTVLGPRSRAVSGDFPSVVTTTIEGHFGKRFVALFVNGAAGNINPISCRGYRCDGTAEDLRHIGRSLAAQALQAMRTSATPLGVHLEVSNVSVPTSGHDEIPIQLIRVGDRVMVAVPGELFVETALEMRTDTSERFFIAGYANGYFGYFPPEYAFRVRCRETERTWWNLAERGVAEKINKIVREMAISSNNCPKTVQLHRG